MNIDDNLFVHTTLANILRYLEHHLPDYPFDPDVDRAFVRELLDDFPDVDILEEVKTFRWYRNNRPATKPRVAIRRWIARGARSSW